MSEVLEKIEGSQVDLFGLEGVTGGIRGDCSFCILDEGQCYTVMYFVLQ